jgi:UDP-N-acetylmuramate-alanine ligase
LEGEVDAGDVILTLGAGDIYRLARRLVAAGEAT